MTIVRYTSVPVRLGGAKVCSPYQVVRFQIFVYGIRAGTVLSRRIQFWMRSADSGIWLTDRGSASAACLVLTRTKRAAITCSPQAVLPEFYSSQLPD